MPPPDPNSPPWPAHTQPTPAQLAAWMQTAPDQIRHQLALALITHGQVASDCFVQNHHGRIAEQTGQIADLQAQLDVARAQQAPVKVKRTLSPEGLAAVRANAVRARAAAAAKRETARALAGEAYRRSQT